MLGDEVSDAGERTPAEIRRVYEERLREVLEAVGVETALEATSADRETITELLAGGSPSITVEDAAAILALDGERPDGETIAAEARDALLLGMATAVLDVETLSSGIDAELEPKEIQQKIEGRFPMTLAEYARLHQYIAARTA
jgi:hypothetical protein